MDFLIHWPPGPVVATVQCQGLTMQFALSFMYFICVYPGCKMLREGRKEIFILASIHNTRS